MNSFAPFDANHPIRLVITITKGDTKGKILARMSQGTIVAHNSLSVAHEAADTFKKLADAIQGEFNSYGLIAVVDESSKENPITYTIPI